MKILRLIKNYLCSKNTSKPELVKQDYKSTESVMNLQVLTFKRDNEIVHYYTSDPILITNNYIEFKNVKHEWFFVQDVEGLWEFQKGKGLVLIIREFNSFRKNLFTEYHKQVYLTGIC